MKLPWACRHVTIAVAVIGPTPGRASNCSTVALLRSTTSPAFGLPDPGTGVGAFDGEGDPEVIELPSAVGWPAAGASPTTICSPSPSGRAMFKPMVSAPSTAPPAARSASAIRAPGARVTSPGVCTKPTTLTTTGWSGPAVGLAEDLGPAVDAFSTGGSFADITGAGRSRTRVNSVINTARTATTAAAMAPVRPGSARTRASQPAPWDASGSQRGSKEF